MRSAIQQILTFSFLVWISQSLIVLGGTYDKYYMMLVGRAIFGVASDMLFISITKILVRRVGDQQGIALGVVMTIPEVASALNSVLSPYLFDKSHTLALPLLFGFGLCLFSFICGVVMVHFDLELEKMNYALAQDENDAGFDFGTPLYDPSLLSH